MNPLLVAAAALTVLIIVGGCVYYALVIVAAIRFRAEPRPEPLPDWPAISVLKPLSGPEPGLEQNLRSFFALDYPGYELLFAVRQESDPAATVVRRLQQEFPQRAAGLAVTGEPPSDYPNAKVYSLARMAERARHPILVISDSDIRADAGYLHGIAADFADPEVGVSTCPYRAVPGGSFWSLLEALGMNTEFWSGILAARLIEGMSFAVGPTMAIRRACLDRLGGFEAVRDYLAEDFVLGRWAGERGYRVVLSHHVVEHHIGSQPFGENFRHRLRWYRSTRRSRPWGYLGQLFTNPLPLALALAAAHPASWTWVILGACFGLRYGALLAVGPGVLGDRLTIRYAWLVPLQDVLSFLVWCLAFFGKTILWRGRRYKLSREGRLQLVS